MTTGELHTLEEGKSTITGRWGRCAGAGNTAWPLPSPRSPTDHLAHERKARLNVSLEEPLSAAHR